MTGDIEFVRHLLYVTTAMAMSHEEASRRLRQELDAVNRKCLAEYAAVRRKYEEHAATARAQPAPVLKPRAKAAPPVLKPRAKARSPTDYRAPRSSDMKALHDRVHRGLDNSDTLSEAIFLEFTN